MKKGKIIYAMIAAGIVIAAILILGSFITVKKVNGWTCALTGSRKGNITWFGCFKTSYWYLQSPIENWIANSNRQIEHKWVRTQGKSYKILSRVFESAKAPEVYHFPMELQEQFLSTASEEQIEAFLELLRSGDQDKIREEGDKLSNKIMKGM